MDTIPDGTSHHNPAPPLPSVEPRIETSPGFGSLDGQLRLGAGEYVPAEGWGATENGRLYFLNALLLEAPGAVQDLHSRVENLFREHRPFLDGFTKDCQARFGHRRVSATAGPAKARRDQKRFARELGTWARTYFETHGQGYLRDGTAALAAWVAIWRLGDEDHLELATIAVGLVSYHQLGSADGRIATREEGVFLAALLAAPLASGPFPDPLGAFRLILQVPRKPTSVALPAWNPYTETRADFEARARNGFEDALRRMADSIDAKVRADGAVPTPIKRRGLDHYRWAVRYQVKAETYAEIARSVGEGKPAVQAAVKKIAAEIGLPLRPPDPPGRPRKPQVEQEAA